MSTEEKFDKVMESLTAIHSKLDVNTERTDQLHKKVFGNGRRGLCERFDIFEGQLSVWKWLAGGSGLLGLVLAAIEIIRMVT